MAYGAGKLRLWINLVKNVINRTRTATMIIFIS